MVSWLDMAVGIFRWPKLFEYYYVQFHRKSFKNSICNQNENKRPTLWIDISNIYQHDARTGIQRVVRAVLTECASFANAEGWDIKKIAATTKQSYRVVSWPQRVENLTVAELAEPISGDWFLGLDLSLGIVPKHKQQIESWKSRGVKVAFVVYDLLPLEHPEWFSAKLVGRFHRWIRTLAILADSVFCISNCVKKDFVTAMQARFGLTNQSIVSYVVPLGSDISATEPSKGIVDGFSEALLEISKGRSALMVGTIEPRKGHVDVIKAFEYLWDRRFDYKLVIVGRPGWLTDTIQINIIEHPNLGKSLFWFKDATDEMLDILYRKTSGVIIASRGEGFGLPLIEAKYYNKKILARELPIFREQEAEGVTYFKNGSVGQLADDIGNWLASHDGSINYSNVFTWHDTAKFLFSKLA